MLSRVANSLYWMVRYIERADNLARLIEVNEQMILDLGRVDPQGFRALWRPIILATGDQELFDETYPNATQREAIHFLTEDRNNPNSIVSCIASARENARMVRDQLAEELWEELNGLYLFLNSEESSRILAGDPSGYYEMIRRSTFTFHGIAAATTMRSEAWDFMDLARHLERADKTTRFLDITTYLEDSKDVAVTADEHWLAILRSCGGVGAFRSQYRGRFSPRNITEFLVFSEKFPRSVRFCVNRLDASLHAISGNPVGTFGDDAERASGQLLSALAFGSCGDAMAEGLHGYLDGLQGRLNDIADAIFRTYVLLPEQIDERPSIPASSISSVVKWQMQQQQQ